MSTKASYQPDRSPCAVLLISGLWWQTFQTDSTVLSLIPEVGGCLGCWPLLREVLRMGVLVWPAVIGVTLELRASMVFK